MKTKHIEYCYPTSAHAKTLGKYNDGCYCVEIWEDNKMPELLIKKPFETAQEAINEAKTIDIPFHPFSLRFYASML